MSAQNNLDKIVLDIFGLDQDEKIFIEAGGSHPFDQNNTNLLERNGWRGLVVEPKTDFNEMYKIHRPKTILENYVLVGFDYEKDEIEGDFNHYMMGGIENVFNFQNWKPSKHKCCHLQKLLDKHNFNQITFMSLDTEGTELGILNGIDFNKTFFHLIIMELHIVDDIKTNFDFLENYNFLKLKTINQHEFFFNKNSKYFNSALNILSK